MKRALATLAVVIAWLTAGDASADTALIVVAADLQDQSGTPAPTNGLVLLVVDTGGDGFATQLLPTSPLSVGSSLAGTDKPLNDRIVAAWDFGSLDTTGQFLNVTDITYDAPVAAGQAIALYWFPSLTLASTNAGGGTSFGLYADAIGIDDSAPWIVPVDGVNPANLVQLNFFTASEGGSNSNTAGRASHLTWTDFQVWQIQYFGGTNNPSATPSVDVDGDGFTNLQEFQAGTNPTNSASFLGITSITRESNNIRVTWMTGLGKTNALERTAGAAGSFSNNFAAIFTVTNTVGSVTNYLDLGAATNVPAFYYRVRLVP